MTADDTVRSINTNFWFSVFKYSIYSLLIFNTFQYFQEDYAASQSVYENGATIGQLIQAFTATVDNSSWVILLLLFELETFILDDETIKGLLKVSMHTVRGICYIFVIYSFYGYLSRYAMVHFVDALPSVNSCDLIGSQYSFAESLDEYVAWTKEVCLQVGNQPLYQFNGANILSTKANLQDIQRLSIAETINSVTWLIIAFLLEIEVWLQQKNKLTAALIHTGAYLKYLLYFTLLLPATYWGITGNFLDFWDAFLWLIAFAFIELNMLNWNRETSHNLDVALNEGRS